MSAERAWWVSWYSLRDRSEFELHSPWWISGYDSDDNDILIAAVLADSEAAAYDKVRAAYDEPRSDDDITERFCHELDQSPFSDRWPRAEWMAWDPEVSVTCACGCQEMDSA